jgi:hypothetical protein
MIMSIEGNKPKVRIITEYPKTGHRVIGEPVDYDIAQSWGLALPEEAAQEGIDERVHLELVPSQEPNQN